MSTRRWHTRAIVLIGALMAASLTAPRITAAQTNVPVGISATRRDAAHDAARNVARDTSTGTPARWQFEQCMGGLTYGAPLKWALAYGMGYVRESDTSDWCFLGAAKIGLGGASMSVGLANSLGHWGSGTALTAGVLRTFNDPMGALAMRTYVGGAVHLWPLLGLGGEIGYYVPMGKDAAGATKSKGIVTWSAGFGF